MIIDRYINGYKYNTQAVSDPDTRQVIFVFDSDQAAQDFADRFPKYCKIRIGKIWDNGKSAPTATIDIDIKSVNRVTGQANETAQKRRDKFIEIYESMQ